MSNSLYRVQHSTMTNLCDAVRSLTSSSSSFTPSELLSQINGFEFSILDPYKYANSTITEFTDSEHYVIGEWAFASCSNLTSVSFTRATYVANQVFSSCYSLTDVYLPNCQVLGEGAFAYCTSLSSISLPRCSYITGKVFATCTHLASVSFPACEYIGDRAFMSCVALTNAHFPKCNYIESSGFWYCGALTVISIPVCDYFSHAFTQCSSLREIYLDRVSRVTTMLGKYIPTGVTSVYVPSSLYSDFLVATNWSAYASKLVSV